MLRTEASEQEAVITICKFMENRYPELKLLHHCPNGGKRDRVSAAVLKRQGVKAGVPDLHLPVPKGQYASLYIEMKYGDGRLQKEQKDFFKTGSRLWKLRCSLLQPGDRAKSNRRLCNAKKRRGNAD